MPLNLKVISICLIVVLIAVFVMFYIFDNIGKLMVQCETDKSLSICKSGTLPIIILMLLLIAGGLIVVVNVTTYILISGA